MKIFDQNTEQLVFLDTSSSIFYFLCALCRKRSAHKYKYSPEWTFMIKIIPPF